MAKVVHEIVSNFDTTIVLKNPYINFAPWKDPVITATKAAELVEWERLLAVRRTKKKGKKGVKAVSRILEDEILQPINIEPSTTYLSVGEGPNTAEQSIFGGESSHAKSKITDTFDLPETSNPNAGIPIAFQIGWGPTDEATAEPEPSEEEGIHFHVCSGNLMSASPWFNRVLKRDGWLESSRNNEDRCFRISAEDWDDDVFLILMNIFHFRNRNVPRTVSLEMLAKIAVLVDYYDCGEAIELFANIWVADLSARMPFPTTYDRTLVLWIWISWVFEQDELFKRSTFIAIEQCTESIQTLGLPIPSWITEYIDLKRYQAIEGVMSGLHELLDTYRSATYQCSVSSSYSFQCGSMLLGALTKGAATANVLSPRPEVPFDGRNFRGMCDSIKAITSPMWYHEYHSQHGCNLETTIKSMVGAVVSNVEGLSLRVEGTNGH